MSHAPTGGHGHSAESDFIPEPVRTLSGVYAAGKVIGGIAGIGALEHLYDSFASAIFSGGSKTASHGGGHGHGGGH